MEIGSRVSHLCNSILPEALLYAWLLTGDITYKELQGHQWISCFRRLLMTMDRSNFNKNWLQKGQKAGLFGEQPIDVAYTVMTLSNFMKYLRKMITTFKMETAFNCF